MSKSIDIEAILAPIPGDNSAGESLKYDPVYDEIKEARREDDRLGLPADWGGELKTADWHKVIDLTVDVLTNRSKDIQIAVWLLEVLVKTEGFSGYTAGSKVLTGLLENFWDNAYPEIEDDDLDWRSSPLEYLNTKVSFSLLQVPITDTNVSPGYSMYDWKESQRLATATGSDREALIVDGKVTPDDLDVAVSKSSLVYYETLQDDLAASLAEFYRFDEVVDAKFGKEAPRLSEIRIALEDCQKQVLKLFKNKGGGLEEGAENEALPERVEETDVAEDDSHAPQNIVSRTVIQNTQEFLEPNQVIRFLGQGGREDSLWKDALAKLKSSGIKTALEMLLGAACSAQSIRDKTNCQILMAKLCLRAGKVELALPIAEEIDLLVTGLQLEKWESPVWLAEVYDTLYQCMTAAHDVDEYKTKELLTKICKIDVTKALQYNQ